MIIYMMRHGETDWNTKGLMQGRDDVPLNENGKNQAKNAAMCLKNALDRCNFKFDKIKNMLFKKNTYFIQ